MRTIVITGATDGIGLALARRFRQGNERLVLVGRRELTALQPPAFEEGLFTPATYCQADLSQLDCAERVEAFLTQQGIERLDLLVHNAALGYGQRWQEQSAESISMLFNVNFWAPLVLTHRLLPWLERAHGKIAFISSVASAFPTPQLAVYGATKAALDGFARSLRVELAGRVSVQVLHPGNTRTAIFEKAGKDVKLERAESAESVAQQIARALPTEAENVNIGPRTGLMRFLGRHTHMSDRRQRRRLAGTSEGSTLERDPAQPRHCVITGAADGIGRALALRYAQAGYTITGIDINAERAAQTQANLEALGVKATFILADLRRDWSWVADLAPADVFVHNAGVLKIERFDSAELNFQRLTAEVNFLAPLQITPRLIQQGKLYRGASLIFVSSLAHYMGFPGAAVYGATKSGVAHYARSLGVLLAPHQHVMAVFPGPVTTGMDRQYTTDAAESSRRRLTAEQLADMVFQAQQRRRPVLLPGRGTRLVAGWAQLSPKRADAMLKRTVLDKLDK